MPFPFRFHSSLHIPRIPHLQHQGGGSTDGNGKYANGNLASARLVVAVARIVVVLTGARGLGGDRRLRGGVGGIGGVVAIVVAVSTLGGDVDASNAVGGSVVDDNGAVANV